MESSHLVIFSTSGEFIRKFNVLRCISLSETLLWTGARGRIPITLKDGESEEPLYKKPNTLSETSTLRSEDFDNYWRPLRETEAQTNLEADWIQSIEQLIKPKVKPASSNFRFLRETFTKCVKKKKNWSFPGIKYATSG